MMSMSPLSPYSLNCSVCGGEYCSKSDWLQHLTTEAHQVLARTECLEGWDKKKVRKCCLVVFSSFPLSGGGNGGADKLIQKFSKDVWTIVTDFVWWEERPYLGVVQFESRKKAREILSTFKDPKEKLLINNEDMIQVRWASDLLRLEWNTILPRNGVRSSINDHSMLVPPFSSATSNGRKSSTDESSHYIISTASPSTSQVPTNNEDGVVGGNSVLEEHEEQLNVNVYEYEIPPQISTAKSKEKCPFYRLNELTAHHKWNVPYLFLASKSKDRKFRYKLVVNGVEYPCCRGSTSIAEAKTLAANNCLRRLRKFWPESNSWEDLTEETGKNSLEESVQGKRPFFTLEVNEAVAETPSKRRKIQHLKYGGLPMSVSSCSDSLQYQFWIVRKAVAISDHEFSKALLVVKSLKFVFSTEKGTTTQVRMFRNCHLKLKTPTFAGNNDLLIYIYSTKLHFDFSSSFTWIPDSLIGQEFKSKRGKKNFQNLEAIEPSENDDDTSTTKIGWKVRHKRTSQIFYLIPDKSFFMEAQVCRLLEYMITFDPRCHSLLTLAYFWSSENSLRFGEIDDDDIDGKYTQFILPEPMSLQWMVMTFLCYQKLVPTPREIQVNPHPILMDELTRVDVGFSVKPKFAEEWISRNRRPDPTVPENTDESSEVFIESVLNLFYEFLVFFGETLESGNWILNTRDGEVISTENFLSSDPGAEGEASWSTKMTANELAKLRSLHRQEDEGEVGVKDKVNFEDWKICMIHPFAFSCKFAVSNEFPSILRKMKTCAINLKTFMKIRKYYGVDAAKMRFGALEDVLKIKFD